MFNTYATMAVRIRKCTTDAEFERVDESIGRCYLNGVFTTKQLRSLLSLWMEEQAKRQVEREDMN